MKYLYIGLALLAVTLAAGIICLCVLNTMVDKTASHLDAAIAAIDRGDAGSAAASAEKAEQTWKHYAGFMGAILDHEETDAVNWGMANIRSYAATGSLHEFRASCVETVAIIRHIGEMENPYYYNIL